MMDFATRDRYRHVVEKIAKQSHLSEGEVAERAIRLAHEGAARKGGDDRTAHVGFYLIDKGLRELEQTAATHLSASETLARAAGRYPLLVYLGAITLITLILTGGLLMQAQASGWPDWMLVLLGVLALLSTSQLAVALVNWLATLLASPHTLPRMDFSRGIPPESRTLVVIPTRDEARVRSLLERCRFVPASDVLEGLAAAGRLPERGLPDALHAA